jgi:hypothetical protein
VCQKCDTRPLCLGCGVKAARVLPCQTFEDLKGPVFCTMFCAARFAFFVGAHHGFHWCATCQVWHTRARQCAECEPTRFTLVERGTG